MLKTLLSLALLSAFAATASVPQTPLGDTPALSIAKNGADDGKGDDRGGRGRGRDGVGHAKNGADDGKGDNRGGRGRGRDGVGHAKNGADDGKGDDRGGHGRGRGRDGAGHA